MPLAKRNSDVGHSYRQHSFLNYLTGFNEPESALVMVQTEDRGPQTFLFLRPRNAFEEIWAGKRLGPENAVSTLDLTEAFSIHDVWTKLPKIMAGVKKVFYEFGLCSTQDKNFLQALKQECRDRGRNRSAGILPIFDAHSIESKMRLHKEPSELQRIRRAAEITSQGFRTVYETLRPGMNERAVQGTLMGEYLKNGSEMEAYPAIVAGGKRACCLHYVENNQTLKDGELLLIDSGSQFEYYASDVTRTFPVGRKFSSAQKILYEAVLSVQTEAIERCVPGFNHKLLHDFTCRALSEKLIDIGLLSESLDEIVEKKLYQRFYPHGTGHWLGMDVHDAGDYSDEETANLTAFGEGMVFTVEPGIYVQPDDQNAPEEFRGIGIRIEDDIAVTLKGPEVLTASIPKDVKSLENRF